MDYFTSFVILNFRSSDVAMKIASLLVARPESKPRSQLSTYADKVSFLFRWFELNTLNLNFKDFICSIVYLELITDCKFL
jgi:hypothetical protein